MKRKFRAVIAMVLCATMLFTGCGGSNADIDLGIDFGFDFFSESSEEDAQEAAADADGAVEFQDPLVERCVRRELGKADGEPVTVEECAMLGQLTIDCDLEYSYINCWTNTSMITVANYVDLSDLKYMTGLRELVIDNDVYRDTLANLDAVTHCADLESLTLQYNPMNTFYSGALPMGYKYLAEITAQLPILKYINLGYPVPAQHQEIVCQGRKNLVFEDDFAEGTYVEQIASPEEWEIVPTQDVDEYLAHWTAEYDERALYCLEADNQETLDALLEELPEDLEDLHLWVPGIDELDIQGVEKFANLKTFSLLNALPMLTYGNDSHPNVALDMAGMDALSSCGELYSVSLAGVKGDFDALMNAPKLKELSVHGCVFDSPEFLGGLTNLRELVIVYNYCENLQEYLLANGSSFENLTYLRTETGDDSDYAGIENYPNLEALSIAYSCGVEDVQYLAQCPKVKYLFFETPNEELDISALKDMESLEYLYINALGDLEKLTGVEAVVSSEIVSVVLPCTYPGSHKEEVFTAINSWIDAAVTNPSMSCFIPGRTIYIDYTAEDAYAKMNFEKLHENGILCRFAEIWLYTRAEEFQTMDQILEEIKGH